MLTFLNTHFSESPEHIRIHKTIFSENRISNGLSNCGLCFNLKVELFLLNVIKAKVNVYVCVWIWICMSMSMCRYMGMDICRCMGVGMYVYVCICMCLYIYIYQLNIAQMSSECSIEKLERNIRRDKSTQDLAWHIYYYLVSSHLR